MKDCNTIILRKYPVNYWNVQKDVSARDWHEKADQLPTILYYWLFSDVCLYDKAVANYCKTVLHCFKCITVLVNSLLSENLNLNSPHVYFQHRSTRGGAIVVSFIQQLTVCRHMVLSGIVLLTRSVPFDDGNYLETADNHC